MNWRRSLIGLGIAVLFVAVLAFGLTRDPSQINSPLPGRPAPDFVLPVMDPTGTLDSVRLAQMRGEVVVLNFWASWCLECRYEHSDLSRTATHYEGRGVRFFGILYEDSPNNGRRWIEMMGGQTYPSLVDPGSKAAVQYGLYGAPETFIIDQNGIVVHKQVGVVNEALLRQIIDPLLTTPAVHPE
jgi:cytochrome c biogenesis protein CcmG/thiol:disulfide interchange protein DsbE